MNAKFALVAIIATATLTGCATTTKPTTPSTPSTDIAFNPTTKQFECSEIGMTALVHYPNSDQITLTIDGKTATLNVAPSASGTRYVVNGGLWGYGGEWHEQGSTAIFSYKGFHNHPAETICKEVD